MLRGARRVLGLALLALAASAPAAHAFEPIEGTWFFENGEVLVESTGPGTFKGTVIKATRFRACPHPVGQRMWEINGSGTHYTGTHIWFTASCGDRPGGESTWDVTSTDPANFQMRFCTAEPGTGPPDAADPCHTLTRTRPPSAPPTAGQVIRLPTTKKCVSRRKFRIRIRKPKGIPIATATVSLNGRRLRVYRRPRLRSTIDLRGLPRGTFTVRIVVTTVTGRRLIGTRRYRTCAKKRRSPGRPRL